jgi:hypothetical protein
MTVQGEEAGVGAYRPTPPFLLMPSLREIAVIGARRHRPTRPSAALGVEPIIAWMTKTHTFVVTRQPSPCLWGIIAFSYMQKVE